MLLVTCPLYHNRRLNYAKLNNGLDLTYEERISIVNECIDFKFMPITKVVKSGTLENGVPYVDAIQILPNGLIIMDYDILVDYNNGAMRLLDILDCVNSCSDVRVAKELCLQKVK